MPQIGDTIKLKVKFYGWDGTPINADGSVTLSVYDRHDELVEEITTGIDNVGVGEYQYDYTIPEGYKGYLSFEFLCQIGGKDALKRGKIPLKWV